jgi:hypothetical protein
MLIDLLMGLSALGIATLMSVFSPRLADLMREGDDRWREQPWTGSFEPDVPFLASDRGRWWIFRAWLLITSAGFLVVGVALVVRAAILHGP